jgi:hypothetical protein
MTRHIPHAMPALLAAVVACAAPGTAGGPATPTSLHPPVLVPSAAATWTGAKAGEAAVATVDGLPLPAGRLARALERSPDADPQAILQAVVAQEVLARKAVAAAGGEVRSDLAVFERALVARLLQDRVGRLQAGDMPRSEVEDLWNIGSVRARYDHLASFEVQDLQWICCDASPAQCGSPQAQGCFADGERRMARVYEEVQRRRPDPEDIPLLIGDLRDLAPILTYQTYEFMYDTARGVQKGRSRFDTAIVDAVAFTPVGHWSKPVRSNFGWHVPYVKAATPEEHRDIADPVVSREIAEFFLGRYQRKAVAELLGTLVTSDRLPSLAPYFKNRVLAPPRWKAEVYPEALREAVEDRAKKREEEAL